MDKLKMLFQYIIIATLFGAYLFATFGLVPLLCELAVKYNWNGFGSANRWFYFFYFLTIPSGINIASEYS